MALIPFEQGVEVGIGVGFGSGVVWVSVCVSVCLSLCMCKGVHMGWAWSRNRLRSGQKPGEPVMFTPQFKAG